MLKVFRVFFFGGVGVSPDGPSVLVLDVTLEVETPVWGSSQNLTEQVPKLHPFPLHQPSTLPSESLQSQPSSSPFLPPQPLPPPLSLLMLLRFIISYSNSGSAGVSEDFSLVIKVMKYSFLLPFSPPQMSPHHHFHPLAPTSLTSPPLI